MSETPLLAVRGLGKAFPVRSARGRGRRRTTLQAVADVSLDVAAGETLGVVGESGCGKSTLARLLVRLLEPTTGTVAFAGRDVSRLKGAALRELRGELQMVFQDPRGSLNPRRTVAAAIAAPLEIHGRLPDPAARRRRVEALMGQVGVGAELADRHPHELSGGQCQRVGIARALALDPKLLVADEPVSALDVSVQAQVLGVLDELRASLGLTLVLVSHDLAVVRHRCDRVAVMYAGRVVELAPTSTLFASPQMPYTQALLASIPTMDPVAPRRPRPVVRGEAPSALDPPPGCPFHPRCPRARERCAAERPGLERVGDALVACHFPGAD